MFRKVLVANRGAIAVRILRTLSRMGVASVAVYSDADRHSPHVRLAGEAVRIGEGPARSSYLDAEAILAAAKATGAEAIHPGYGFLSENAAFARACGEQGILWIGPDPEAMERFGPKHSARAIATSLGVPLLPGTGLLASVDEAVLAAECIGYPVMLKATAGGGGIGMRVCRSAEELRNAWEAVVTLAQSNFKDSGVFVERFVERARHIEVQVFGTGSGEAIALGERDCSAQRRNQKVLEETPAPDLPDAVRKSMHAAAERLAQGAGYRSAGTVEFLYDPDRQEFYFLEVNTRLQVEHGVTEEVLGIDLVEWMLREACGELSDLRSLVDASRGHSIQARVYAEDPHRNFAPSAGLLDYVEFPVDARVETWVETGTEVSGFYDPMLAKIIVHAPTRTEALLALRRALATTRISGIESNVEWLRQVVAHTDFTAGGVTTGWLGTVCTSTHAFEVLDGGTLTTVQDWPGRLGHWDVGVPPCGPMDDRSFRIGNQLLGNPEGAAGLEMTLKGATLRFRGATTVCLAGAAMAAELDGVAVSFWKPFAVAEGQVLRVGSLTGRGMRSYLLVAGGLDVPEYLGSRSTFTLGNFGGHAGRALRSGDVVHFGTVASKVPDVLDGDADMELPEAGMAWEIGASSGPHCTVEYLDPQWMEEFFAAEWEVHFNSARTGVRLIGPRPKWTRSDGGDAGLHPSNLHDNAYAIGSLDFTGDMPVILGPDGPSLGGFVCPAVVDLDELWKLGQLRPGDKVRFRESKRIAGREDRGAILADVAEGLPFRMLLRRAGDANVLVEYGDRELDLRLRFRVHALQQAVESDGSLPVVDLTPGIRSLQVHFDPARISMPAVVDTLLRLERALPPLSEVKVPSRIVHLPLSWDDPATRLAIERYQTGVRPDAPWCPSNIEFIRRINGLADEQAVKDIVFGASYLVLGLGDVYLGAPVAVPVDPRHRLVTTKYNPARTWTPENAVGIGGSYLCVYGMEGPGGYQFVGRTVQMWNRFRSTTEFAAGKPWLLRFFDQIRFYPVSSEELLRLRDQFPQGLVPVQIENTEFDLGKYLRWLEEMAPETEQFRSHQQASFQAERDRWKEQGLAEYVAETATAPAHDEEPVPEGCTLVSASMPGSVWKLAVGEGDRVKAGQTLLVAESMKMEMPVESPVAGVVRTLRVKAGEQIVAGQALLVLEDA